MHAQIENITRRPSQQDYKVVLSVPQENTTDAIRIFENIDQWVSLSLINPETGLADAVAAMNNQEKIDAQDLYEQAKEVFKVPEKEKKEKDPYVAAFKALYKAMGEKIERINNGDKYTTDKEKYKKGFKEHFNIKSFRDLDIPRLNKITDYFNEKISQEELQESLTTFYGNEAKEKVQEEVQEEEAGGEAGQAVVGSSEETC